MIRDMSMYRNVGMQIMEGVAACRQPSKVEIARQRFGQPFAHEPGATWQPRKEPVLTEWMRTKKPIGSIA